MEFSSSNIGVGSHSLLLGIFPTQGVNPGLMDCRRILHCLSHQGSPNLSIQRLCSSFPLVISTFDTHTSIKIKAKKYWLWIACSILLYISLYFCVSVFLCFSSLFYSISHFFLYFTESQSLAHFILKRTKSLLSIYTFSKLRCLWGHTESYLEAFPFFSLPTFSSFLSSFPSSLPLSVLPSFLSSFLFNWKSIDPREMRKQQSLCGHMSEYFPWKWKWQIDSRD